MPAHATLAEFEAVIARHQADLAALRTSAARQPEFALLPGQEARLRLMRWGASEEEAANMIVDLIVARHNAERTEPAR